MRDGETFVVIGRGGGGWMEAEQELIMVIWEEGSQPAAGGDPERQFGLQISQHSCWICSVVSLHTCSFRVFCAF